MVEPWVGPRWGEAVASPATVYPHASPRSIPGERRRLDHVDAVEVLHGLAEARGHRLLARAQRHARVVVLLVGLGLALGVANLALQVVAVLGLVLADAVPERPL